MPPHVQCLFYFTVHFMLSLSPCPFCSCFLAFCSTLFFVPFSFVLLLVSLCVLFLVPFSLVLFPFHSFYSFSFVLLFLPPLSVFTFLFPSVRLLFFRSLSFVFADIATLSFVFADRRATARTTTFVEPCSFQKKKSRASMLTGSLLTRECLSLSFLDSKKTFFVMCSYRKRLLPGTTPPAIESW